MIFIQIAGSLTAFGFALLMLVGARGAMHEATAGAFFAASAMLFAGASITIAVNAAKEAIVSAINNKEQAG